MLTSEEKITVTGRGYTVVDKPNQHLERDWKVGTYVEWKDLDYSYLFTGKVIDVEEYIKRAGPSVEEIKNGIMDPNKYIFIKLDAPISPTFYDSDYKRLPSVPESNYQTLEKECSTNNVSALWITKIDATDKIKSIDDKIVKYQKCKKFLSE